MIELFWFGVGVLSTFATVILIVVAASNTEDVKSATTAFLGAIAFGVLAAYCLGHNIDVWLPYKYPLHTLGLLVCYVLVGLLYSCIRWLTLNYRLSRARTALWLYWLNTRFASARRFIIADMVYKYCHNAPIDPAVKDNLENINIRLDCETLADLKNRIEAAGASLDIILKFEPAGVTAAYFKQMYNAEASGNPVEFLRAVGLANLPTPWQSEWRKTLNSQVMGFREGFDTRLMDYSKPELQARASLISSWLVIWPACLIVNTVVDAGQLCSTAAQMLVDRLGGLYTRLANSVWREE